MSQLPEPDLQTTPLRDPSVPQPETPGAVLSVTDLRVRFGSVTAVDGISLTIPRGGTLALVGESGSGKSATSLAILRLLASGVRVTGSIRLRDQELLALPEPAMRRLRGSVVSMIFQEPMTALNPVMTIGRQVSEALTTHHPRLTHTAVRTRVLQVLREVALPDPEQRLSHFPHQFSGGQRQRILIAMAIINRPQLLIADEPTTALDVTVQAQILALLGELRQSHRLAMLFISHDLAVVRSIADTVAVMRHGRLVESGPAAQLFAHPDHPYTRRLLDSVPSMRTDRNRPLGTLSAAGDG